MIPVVAASGWTCSSHHVGKDPAMSTQSKVGMSGLFDQAVQTFSEALSAGVKVHEEAAQWWSDALDKQAPLRDWQKRGASFMSEAIPAVQKNTEEWLRVMEQNHRRSMSLLQSAFTDEESQASDLQARTQKLWEQSLETIRDSAQATAKANVKMMEMWSEVLKRNMNGEPEKSGAGVGTT
jgi:hypothetical protein